MTKLLEMREKIRSAYFRYDVWFRVAGKFLLAFCVYFSIGSQIGYEGFIQMPVLIVGLSLISACLPAGAISFLMCCMIVAGLWSIGTETGIVALCVFLLMVLLYFIFKPRYNVLMAVAMLASICGISGILPIAAALLFSPLTLVPMGLGIIAAYMIVLVKNNYSILASQSDRLTSIEKIIYYVEQLMNNDRMLLFLIGFILTFLVVYRVRKLPYSYAWSVAIPCGTMVFVLVMLTGNVVFDVSIRMTALIVSCVIGVLFAILVTVFSFVLDGTRTEYLEYEDEEYYYFVKAIPKVSVTVADKKIKRITERHQSGMEEAEDSWSESFEEDAMGQSGENEDQNDTETEKYSERND